MAPAMGTITLATEPWGMKTNSRNNIIKLEKGKLGVINGLEGFIVAEHDNVLLICKKEDSSALVRKYVNEVLLKKGSEYI